MENKYSFGKTASKAAPPFLVLLLVPALKAALTAAGITLSDQDLYSIVLAGYGSVIALINWLKNKNRGKGL